MSSTQIRFAPIFIGYDWAGISLPFPADYLAAGETIKATIRKRPGATGVSLTSVRDGDTVTLSLAAAATANLDPLLYLADLIVVTGDGDVPLNSRLYIPVERGAASDDPTSGSVEVTVEIADRGAVSLVIDAAPATAARQFAEAAAASADDAAEDAQATAADRTATHADRLAADADATATAADRTQTGLDRVATAADRVQTALDVTAADASAGISTTQAGIATTKAGEANASAASVSAPIPDRTALAAISPPANGTSRWLAEAGMEGWFKFSTANLSASVTADTSRAIYVAPASASTGASGAWVRIWDGAAMRVGWFGPAGDGTTDDTTALQAAITYACTLNVARILFDAKTYKVTNLVLPSYGGTMWKVIELVGAVYPGTIFGTIGASILNTSGTIIKSSATTGNGILSVAQFGTGSLSFSNYILVVRDINLRTYDNPQIHALNATWAQQLIASNLQIDTGVYSVQATLSTHVGIAGLITPNHLNAALNKLDNIAVSGYNFGVYANEHTRGDYLNLTGCKYALVFNTADHASHFGRVAVQACQNGLYFPNGQHAFTIEQYDTEHESTGNFVFSKDIEDPSNYGVGNLRWWTVDGGVGASATFVKNGGTGINVSRVGRPIFGNATRGDVAATLTSGTDKPTQVWNTALTADRAVTLSTTNAVTGDKFRIVRNASATGAFNLNIGTGPLKALASAGTWAEVEYSGAVWFLSASGSL